MRLVTTKFKLGGLHEKHVVATWNVGNHLSICFFNVGRKSVPLMTNFAFAELPSPPPVLMFLFRLIGLNFPASLITRAPGTHPWSISRSQCNLNQTPHNVSGALLSESGWCECPTGLSSGMPPCSKPRSHALVDAVSDSAQ
jgi:hypothetical protein